MRLEEWLDNRQLAIDMWKRKYQYKNETLDEWLDRVSNGNKEIKELIIDKKFIPAGRILANRGLHKEGKNVCYSNCFVNKPPEDTLESIFDTAKKMARTYSLGGGCGTSIRNLRPRGSKVNNSAETSTGAVSFMDLYSLTTDVICQEGRRGALMLSIPDNHPDLIEFINAKKDHDKINSANISIEVSDEFMKAVEHNEDWELKFETDTGETIKEIVNAKEVFNMIMESNWSNAEPAMLFWDRINNWSMLSEDPEFEFAGVNP